MKKIALLLAVLSMSVIAVLPAVGATMSMPLLSQSNDQSNMSGASTQTFNVSGGGDNSNNCQGVQGVSNTGSLLDNTQVSQYAATGAVNQYAMNGAISPSASNSNSAPAPVAPAPGAVVPPTPVVPPGAVTQSASNGAISPSAANGAVTPSASNGDVSVSGGNFTVSPSNTTSCSQSVNQSAVAY